MKKFIFGVIAASIACSAFFTNLAWATVSEMVVRDFRSEYYISKDADGRSTMKVIENITAEFAQDQSHRLIRKLPLYYNHHLTDLQIISVTDEDGLDLKYEEVTDNGYLAVKIGDLNVYVNGIKHYVITYQQKDITKYFSNTNDDEFYWNINGSNWERRIDRLSATVHIDPSISEGLNGKTACYYGPSGSHASCDIGANGNEYTSTVYDLAPGDSMSMVIGFVPNYFTPYKVTTADFIQKYISVISLIAGITIFVLYVVYLSNKSKGGRAKKAIIAQYLPPKDSDIAISSKVYGKPSPWTAAMYVDLAVRHNIKIIEDGTVKGKYSLEFVSLNALSENEKAVVFTLFGNSPQAGARYIIDPDAPDLAIMPLLRDIYKNLGLSMLQAGYYEKPAGHRAVLLVLSVLMFIQALISVRLTSVEFSVLPGLPQLFLVLAVMMLINLFKAKFLSPKGRELLDYLLGLKLYISVAEEERIKILQSPQGAEKTPVDINDKSMLVHLYERVLPYAILFGQEKEWVGVLGRYYEETNIAPEWYVGVSGSTFDFGSFSSSFSDFSSDVGSSGSGFDSGSSDFGGSDGGGSSDGGGGDGGGGDD